MADSLQEITDQLARQLGLVDCDYDAPNYTSGKLVGAAEIGSTVIIEFVDDSEDGAEWTQKGVVFTLPGYDPKSWDMAAVVQIAEPFFPGDMDGGGPLWFTLDELLHNPQIRKVRVQS